MTRSCAAFMTIALATTVVAIGPFAAPASAQAQTAAGPVAAHAGPAPRMPNGRADLTGVWWFGSDLRVRPLGDAPAAPSPAAAPAPRPRPVPFASLYQPWAAEKARTLGDKDDPTLRCTPVAFGTLNVSLFGVGFLGQIVQTPTFVVMLTETFHTFRIIPTDGRPHRDDVLPSPRGDAIGRWEGETLVVDITNFTDSNWMQAEGIVSFHSDALHIVERYTRVDANTLEVEARVEDPKVLTAPWVVPKQTLTLAPFDQIMEVGCTNTDTAGLMEGAAKQNYGRK